MIGALHISRARTGEDPLWRITPIAGPDRASAAIGRTPEEAAQLLVRLFNLCAAAHGVAAAQALGLDEPLGPEPSDLERAHEGHARALGGLSLAAARQERLRDHALAVCLEWPAILGAPADRDTLRRLGTGAEPEVCRTALLGHPAIALAEASITELERWLRAGASPLSRLLARVRALHPAWGQATLACPDAPDIAQALEAGAPLVSRETTAADAWLTTPLMAALIARDGVSLFVRLLGRVMDVLDILAPPHAQRADLLPRALPSTGLARAARGLLAHRAHIEDGRVTHYRVLAPSAWNLAPGGLLARMLAALPWREETPMLARLAIACVNPCVPVRLDLQGGVDA